MDRWPSGLSRDLEGYRQKVPVLIGTSGWHYSHWKDGFYPAGLASPGWLRLYAERFSTVEVNNAFYRLPEESTFQRWADQVPADFVVAVKASRYLTHVRRLKEPADPVRRLMERLRPLKSKLGPILLQLPPNLSADLEALDAALRAFPVGVRVAVEARHDSWFQPPIRRLLEERGAALCLTDRSGPSSPLWRTSDWGYVRFHCGRGRPDCCYGRAALDGWARRLADLWSPDADTFVYFNNDMHGCAPRDARRFALSTAAIGLRPTRVPGLRQTPIRPS
jgi:uncharacterized protein YecE (DUF72 family)